MSGISEIGNNFQKANKYIVGFGSGNNFDVKKLLFDADGKVMPGNVPSENTGSAFGYGYAKPSSTTASTGI